MQNINDKETLVILRTLAYYDIFNYPLTEEDILSNCGLQQLNDCHCKNTLQVLVDSGVVHKMGDYYGLSKNHQNVTERIKGNERAENWKKKARWFSKLIAGFPFVRGIALSGSLSKGVIGKDPDIDYFIITQPNRLWLTRTLLVAFKKIFLLNSYKYFCINYFVDTESLEIEEKNLFTATEVTTLIPTYGQKVANRFYEKNQWIRDYYPNFKNNGTDMIYKPRYQPVKRSLEFLLAGKIGDMLDNRFMDITTQHWFKKFHHQFPEDEFNLVFKSSKTISKHHPRNFQKVVLQEFRKRVAELEKKFNIRLEEVLSDDVKQSGS